MNVALSAIVTALYFVYEIGGVLMRKKGGGAAFADSAFPFGQRRADKSRSRARGRGRREWAWPQQAG